MPSPRARPLVALVVVALVAVPVHGITTHSGHPDAQAPSPASAASADDAESATLAMRSGPRVDWGELDTRSAVEAAIATGKLPRTRFVAVGDPLVLEVGHAGLSDHLAGGNATARFFELLQGPETNLTVWQTNPGAEREPKRLRLTRDTSAVVPDAANDTTYVVVDTARVEVERDGHANGAAAELRGGERFQAKLRMTPGSNLTGGESVETASVEFLVRVREAQLAVDDDIANLVYVQPASNQTLRGRTNVRPSLNVTVVVTVRDDPETPADESFVVAQPVPVRDADGSEAHRFSAAFDFAGVPQNSTAAVDVRFDGRSLLESGPTLVVAAPIARLRTVEVVPDAAGPYTRVSVEAHLSRGGFAVLHLRSADGRVVGASGFLPRGTHRNVTVYVGKPIVASGRLVVVAHRDPNGNRWFDGADVDLPYAESGTTVSVDTGHVVRPHTLPRATRPRTPTLRGSPPSGDTTVPSPAPDSTSTWLPLPGFGFVVTVVALLAFGALARHRR